MPRAIHYEPDNDAEQVFCGTDGEFEQHHFTPYDDQVTCKRCLKILARYEAQRLASAIRSKASAWDALAERTKQIGYADPWDAMAELCRQKGLPVFAEF